MTTTLTFPKELEGVDFELSEEISSYHDEKHHIDLAKGKALIAYLVSDPGNGGVSDYFNDLDEGQFISFETGSIYHQIMFDGVIKTIFKKYKGRAFWVSKYDHSLVKYYLSGTQSNECPWDTSQGCAIYIAPDATPNPEKYAKGVLERFTAWCNGDIYAVAYDYFERTDKSTWKRIKGQYDPGYMGDEDAKTALEDQWESCVKEFLNDPRQTEDQLPLPE